MQDKKTENKPEQSSGLIGWWRRFMDGDRSQKETEFLPSILEVTEEPPSPVGRMVLWTLTIFIAVALAWAFIGEIDEIAVADGKVIPTGEVKLVQSENKGVIKEIAVRDGDYVEAGQTLVVLDTTKTEADVGRLAKQLAYFNLTIDRLNAEMQDRPFVAPSPSDMLSVEDIRAQQALYDSRRAQLRATIEKQQTVLEQETAAIQGAQAQQEKYRSMLAVAKEKEERLNELFEQDAVSYFQLLEARATRIEYQKTAEALVQEIAKERGKYAEAQEAIATAVADYRKQAMTDLVDAKKQANSFDEELKKATQTNVQSVIKAPVSGHVSQLNVHTLGGVVTEGETLMIVVPNDAVMEFEAYADNKDIGFISVGQEAEVKVETFNFQKYGMVIAEVEDIGADAIVDKADTREKEQNTNGKYRVILKVIDDNGVPLSPGMNVSAEIKTNKKRIIDFFLDPFREMQDEALRER